VNAGRDDLGEDVKPDVGEQQRRDRFGDEPGMGGESAAPLGGGQCVEAVAPGATEERITVLMQTLLDVLPRQRQVSGDANGCPRLGPNTPPRPNTRGT